jgi:putative oxidoreductase
MTKNYAKEEVSSSRLLKNSLRLIGRILLSAIFLITGFGQAFHWSGVMVFTRTGESTMPISVYIIALAVIFQFLGGISLLLGYKTRIGAILLIIFIMPVTLYYHHFWDLDDLSQVTQIQMFFKNVAIMGGLFGIVANGPGAWSIDSYRMQRLRK